MKTATLFFSTLATCHLASAALTTQAFTGVVTQYQDTNGIIDGVSVNTPITGFFTINDSEIIMADPSTGIATFTGSISISLPNIIFAAENRTISSVLHDSPPQDQFGSDFFNLEYSSRADGPLIIDGLNLGSIIVNFTSSIGMEPITNESKLPYIVDIDAFSSAIWSLEVFDEAAGHSANLSGTIGSVTVVPEPSTYALAFGMFVALTAIYWRNH